MATLTSEPQSVPLRRAERGVVRVGETRVSLDSVIHEFNTGACPEEIVRSYPTLQLAEVYEVIAYYLRHKVEVDAYVERRRAEAAKLREEIEAKQPDRDEFRETLLARQALKRQQQERPEHASPTE